MSEYAIEMRGITKTFPGVVANDNVTLQVRPREIHALLGENGAGKSTLMSILFGSYSADSGPDLPRRERCSSRTPRRHGTGHRHGAPTLKLVQNYTVTENIVWAWGRRRGGSSISKRPGQGSRAGRAVRPLRRSRRLDRGDHRRPTTAGGDPQDLFRNANIIIFDEPTAVLTPGDRRADGDLRKLKSEGKTILLITHKLRRSGGGRPLHRPQAGTIHRHRRCI